MWLVFMLDMRLIVMLFHISLCCPTGEEAVHVISERIHDTGQKREERSTLENEFVDFV